MPRVARHAPGGLVYHVLNRGVGRMRLFHDDAEYRAFLRAFRDVLAEVPVRVCGFCAMPNHWHLVLWPAADGELARFMQRLTVTHVRRWAEHRRRVGWGSVYQGRYKSFPMQGDEHFATVVRYVERNPLRANLVRRAQDWPWSSLGQGRGPGGAAGTDEHPVIPICDWPVPRRANWTNWVNAPATAAEDAAVRRAVATGRPYGSPAWAAATEAALGLPPLRPRGRPRKEVPEGP